MRTERIIEVTVFDLTIIPNVQPYHKYVTGENEVISIGVCPEYKVVSIYYKDDTETIISGFPFILKKQWQDVEFP